MTDQLEATAITVVIVHLSRRQAVRIARQRRSILRALRASDGCVFAKVVGTSKGMRTDGGVDLRRWVIVTFWNSTPPELGNLPQWLRNGSQVETYELQPTHSIGSWDGVGVRAEPGDAENPGPCVVLTRARVRPAKWLAFRSQSTKVELALGSAEGVRDRFGFGEWPVLLLGTFSIWESESHLDAFLRSSRDHATARRRTRAEGWYAEELFMRCQVRSHTVGSRTSSLTT